MTQHFDLVTEHVGACLYVNLTLETNVFDPLFCGWCMALFHSYKLHKDKILCPCICLSVEVFYAKWNKKPTASVSTVQPCPLLSFLAVQ